MIATAAAVAMIIALLLSAHLSLPAKWPPERQNYTEIVAADPEIIDIFTPTPRHASSAAAAAPEPARKISKPNVAAAKIVSSARKTDIKQPAAANDKAIREARDGVANAFKTSADATDNTTSDRGKEHGNSGHPDGTPGADTADGTGQGSVGGGWIMPHYAKVPAYSTGSIELRATVDRHGNATNIVLTGGKAPAAADNALVQRCIAEVRRHKFTRNDSNAPETATARIIYTFR